ncbi:MAG: hypothetical protein MI748_19615 [Opitutales bacterium]|nr:hypothetical protein [Opitutales bacterium]
MRKTLALIFLILIASTLTTRASDCYLERNYYGARLEPEKTVLHGAGQDFESYHRYSELMGSGKRPSVYMTYIGLTRTDGGVEEWCTRTEKEGRDAKVPIEYLQIGVNMTGGNDTGEGEATLVGRGDFDTNIARFLDTLEAIGLPAYLRIGYEFEGSWNNYTPEGFKAAWIRITREVRKRHMVAATVWCSAGNSAGPKPLEEVMTYYPGDEWVDWWGVDIFDAEEILSDWTMAFMDAAHAHQKPVMLGETTPRYVGVENGQQSWDGWFRDFFTLIRKRPEIKSFCYINWDWYYWSEALGFQWHDWLDARLERNELVASLYLEEMNKELYQHAEEQQN